MKNRKSATFLFSVHKYIEWNPVQKEQNMNEH